MSFVNKFCSFYRIFSLVKPFFKLFLRIFTHFLAKNRVFLFNAYASKRKR